MTQVLQKAIHVMFESEGRFGTTLMGAPLLFDTRTGHITRDGFDWDHTYSSEIKQMAAELRQVGDERYMAVLVDDPSCFFNRQISGTL